MNPNQDLALKSRALHKELGISPAEQPPTAYRLLGLTDFEEDPEVIQAAYYRRIDLLKQVKSGEFYDIVQGVIMNEVTQAYKRLSKPESHEQYKAALLKQREAAKPIEPIAPTVAVTPVAGGPPKPPPRRTTHPESQQQADLSVAAIQINTPAKPLLLKPVKKKSSATRWAILVGMVALTIILVVVLKNRNQDDTPPIAAKPVPAAKPNLPTTDKPAPAIPEENSDNNNPPPEPMPADLPETPSEVPSTTPSPVNPRPMADPLPAELLSRIDRQGVDLLPLINTRRDFIKGTWQEKQGVVVTGGEKGHLLQVPYDLPTSYAVKLVARKVKGQRLVNGWMMGGKNFLSVLSLHQLHAGLSKVDGKTSDENQTKVPLPELTDGNVTLYATVTPTKFFLQYNGEPLLVWDQGPARLSLGADWRIPHANRLSLALDGMSLEYTELKILSLDEQPMSAVTPEPSQVDDRRPLPDAAEIVTIRAQVREIFQEDFTRSTRHTALADKLFTMSQEESNPARRYTLLGESRALATANGNFDLALRVARQTSKEFQLDPAETLFAFLQTYPQQQKNNSLAKSQWQQLALTAIELCQDHLAQEQFDQAKKFLELGITAGNRSAIPALTKQLQGALPEFTAYQQLAEAGRNATTTLATTPDDPVANLQAGLQLAVIKSRLPEALPLLAKSGHDGWQQLAKLTSDPGKTADPLRLGEAWSELAKSDNAAVSYFCLARAREQNAAALPKLTGLVKVALEKRQAEIESRLANSLFLAHERKPLPSAGSSEMYLGDLPLLEARVWGNKSLRTLETVEKVLYQHALFAHPADNTPSKLVFDLGGNYKTLNGMMGMGDTGYQPGTNLTWRVVGDGRELWNSGPLRKRHWKSPPFTINVQGVKRLELYCDCPGSNYAARAYWLDPKVSR